jgi:hypothetical protein
MISLNTFCFVCLRLVLSSPITLWPQPALFLISGTLSTVFFYFTSYFLTSWVGLSNPAGTLTPPLMSMGTLEALDHLQQQNIPAKISTAGHFPPLSAGPTSSPILIHFNRFLRSTFYTKLFSQPV